MKRLIIIGATLALVACSGGNSSIYSWGKGEYPESVYTTLNQEGDPQEQIHNLETLLAKPQGKVPPGLYAQLGLLYTQIGNSGKAFEAYNKEAELFPEAKQYMQFLMNNGKKMQGGK